MKLLIENWGDSFKEQILEKILLIKNGSLKPEFPIPDNDEELISFLGVNKVTNDEESREESRNVRKRLRKIAKDDAVVYKDEAHQAL